MFNKVSETHYKLVSEIFQLKKDFAIKKEELQALYIEFQNQSNFIDKLKKENHSLKQQIKQLEAEAEEMLQYP
tara:strand:- start:2519 stop:2737 length:219 start_codon:yes stop_codon:yes gene_type:complete